MSKFFLTAGTLIGILLLAFFTPGSNPYIVAWNVLITLFLPLSFVGIVSGIFFELPKSQTLVYKSWFTPIGAILSAANSINGTMVRMPKRKDYKKIKGAEARMTIIIKIIICSLLFLFTYYYFTNFILPNYSLESELLMSLTKN